MRYFSFLAALAVLATASVSCSKTDKIGPDEPDDPQEQNPYKPLSLTQSQKEIVKAGNTFALEFLDKVGAESKGSFVISPLSMQFLLGMLVNGAQEETAEEICKVLGYGASESGAINQLGYSPSAADALNQYSLYMMENLPKLDKKTTLCLANALWVNKNYPLLSTYKEKMGKFYLAEVSNMDFSDLATTSKINQWCSNKTNGLIPKVLDNVSESALAYLMNALYFKSQWKEKFKKEDTSNKPFTDESGNTVQVPMMQTKKSFMYQDNETLRAIHLPYGNGAYAMIVILPAKGKTLSDVTTALKTMSFDSFLASMVPCNVDLWLPKFETKFHIKLNSILSDMGMPSSFSPSKANFKAMSDYALCLDFVIQDAVIKVDEEGTEAAAVSTGGMMPTSVYPGQNVTFHADHPFLYLITENSTRAILFAGRYTGK